MKRAKLERLERQQKERERKEEERRKLYYDSLSVVTLNPTNERGLFTWKCPSHDSSFSYSKEINARWGHPENLIFCAVCCKHYKFEQLEGVTT